MSTVLRNGIIIPDNGSRNWGGDLANNWNILDVNVGYMNDVKSKITTLENSVAENTANIQTNASNISALQTSKQDVIEDLETIRAGASSGATAVQPSALSDYATKSELSSKANDGEVVHKSGDETIEGVKRFSGIIVGMDNFNLQGGGDWDAGARLTLNKKTESMSVILQTFSNTDSSAYVYDTNAFYPYATNKIDLGTSANKWKTLNSINPGALSLPNPSPSGFISKSLPASGGTITADVDGWFEIRTKATSPNALIQLFVAGGSSTYAKNTGDTLIISVPMRAGVSVTIFYKDIETSTVCRLIPCLGNI